jgi:hypothetical protein
MCCHSAFSKPITFGVLQIGNLHNVELLMSVIIFYNANTTDALPENNSANLIRQDKKKSSTLNTSTRIKTSAFSRLTVHPLGTHDTMVSMIV